MKTPSERAPHTSAAGWTPAQGFPIPGALSQGDGRIGFVLQLGYSLHTSGYAADRLEEAMELASDKLGLRGQFFSTPTSIMASFGPQDDQQTFLMRVEPGAPNLGKLARVDEITRKVITNQTTPSEGSIELAATESAPAPYPKWLTTAAFALVSASGARFLGGGWNEILAGFVIGLVIGVLSLIAERHSALGRVFHPLAALTASIVAAGMAAAGVPLSVFLATLAGVIVLIPGLMITTAMTELSTQHLASGTARFMGALVLLLGIAFGIALGTELGEIVLGRVRSTRPTPLPFWTLLPSLLVSPLAFLVLLKADARDAGWIVASGIVSFGGAFFGSKALGPELGTFVGALATGVGSNWYARITNRPAQIALVPGLLLLVPGSVGLRSLASMVDNNVILGVETAFRMLLIAVSLVAGMMMANVVSPRRRMLA